MIDLNYKRVFISGGTGSFGKKYLYYLLENYPDISKIIIYSRDEFKQHQIKIGLPKESLLKVEFILGDIRDFDRLTQSLVGVDYLIHAAALKHVSAGEENPTEFIKTNIIGSENIIKASILAKVKKVIAMSTDKAVLPVSLYGATKLCADKLFISANDKIKNTGTIFSVVRYGNLLGSRGSVLPLFLEKAKSGVIPITDKNMTRFHISYSEVVTLIMFALNNSKGGEIFVPKLPSFRILDLAKAIDPYAKIEIIGARQGEKLHEELIDSTYSTNLVELDSYYIVFPNNLRLDNLEHLKQYNPKMNKESFSYTSDRNVKWLNVDELKTIIHFEMVKEIFS